jgi:hypothetical protein
MSSATLFSALPFALGFHSTCSFSQARVNVLSELKKIGAYKAKVLIRDQSSALGHPTEIRLNPSTLT